MESFCCVRLSVHPPPACSLNKSYTNSKIFLKFTIARRWVDLILLYCSTSMFMSHLKINDMMEYGSHSEIVLTVDRFEKQIESYIVYSASWTIRNYFHFKKLGHDPIKRSGPRSEGWEEVTLTSNTFRHFILECKWNNLLIEMKLFS